MAVRYKPRRIELNSNRIYIIVNEESFSSTLSKLEKLYFLISDEQSNYDFINILLNLQKKYEKDIKTFELIEKKIQEKQRIIQRIRMIRKEIEEELRKRDKTPIIKLFLTSFLQKV